MAEDLIRYDILAQDALRGVVRKVLSEVARTGLPGEHHFFISFATKAPGVRISSRLLAQYPEEMTIVLQHQYRDLTVTDTAFEVGLSFNNVPERLLVPFAAIKGFADPSVQFGLQFELAPKPVATDAAPTEVSAVTPEAPVSLPAEAPATPVPVPATAAQQSEVGDDEAGEERPEAEVVSLDAFRKK
jgi:hypothetical protein